MILIFHVIVCLQGSEPTIVAVGGKVRLFPVIKVSEGMVTLDGEEEIYVRNPTLRSGYHSGQVGSR